MSSSLTSIQPSLKRGSVEPHDVRQPGNLDRNTYVQQRILQLMKIQSEEQNSIQRGNIGAVLVEYESGRFPTQELNEMWVIDGTISLAPPLSPPPGSTAEQYPPIVFHESAPYFKIVQGEAGPEEIACFSPRDGGRTAALEVRRQRLEYLRELLNDQSASHQHQNIEAVLAEYRSGRWDAMLETKEPAEQTQTEFWLVDGKPVADIQKEELLPTSRLWREDVGRVHHQLAITGSYPLAISIPGQHNCFHDISARIRCYPNKALHWQTTSNGSPTAIAIQFLNDTGSSMLTLHDPEVWHLSIDGLGLYPGRTGFTMLSTANGLVSRETCTVEMQLLDIATGSPLTNWFIEDAVITPRPTTGPNIRLSGSKMRQHMYFATPPMNLHLYVSNNKTGLMQTMPAVTNPS